MTQRKASVNVPRKFLACGSTALTTNEFGRATEKLPLDRGGSACVVRVGEQERQSPLAPPETSFRFDLPAAQQMAEQIVAPEPPVTPDPPVPPVVKEEPPVDEEVPPEGPETRVAQSRGMSWWWLLLLLLLMAAGTFVGCYFILF